MNLFAGKSSDIANLRTYNMRSRTSLKRKFDDYKFNCASRNVKRQKNDNTDIENIKPFNQLANSVHCSTTESLKCLSEVKHQRKEVKIKNKKVARKLNFDCEPLDSDDLLLLDFIKKNPLNF